MHRPFLQLGSPFSPSIQLVLNFSQITSLNSYPYSQILQLSELYSQARQLFT